MTAETTSQRQLGITLVELLVSILLASILSAGLFYLMSGQSRTYSNQVSNLTTQENLWASMEYLQRQIRMAGYGFGRCPQAEVRMKGGGVSPIFGLKAYNRCNLLTTNPSNDTEGDPTGACLSGTDGPDSLTVTYARPNDGAAAGLPALRLARPLTTGNGAISVNAAGNFTPCDMLVVWEPATANSCYLFRQSDPPSPNGALFDLPHAGSGSCAEPLSTYNNPGIIPTYPAGSLVARLAYPAAMPRHFAVDQNANPPRLVTWTSLNANPGAGANPASNPSFEVVADGVEDMQIAWACDGDGDGEFREGASPAAKQNDEWAHNVASDNLPACGAAPIGMVRITLVARSAGVNPDVRNGKRPAAEDNPAGPIDQYSRAVLTSTVRPRNLR